MTLALTKISFLSILHMYEKTKTYHGWRIIECNDASQMSMFFVASAHPLNESSAFIVGHVFFRLSFVFC